MISGAVAAALFALLFLTATVGALAVGFWASGASPETNGNLSLIWFDDNFASISFVAVILGLICGLGTPLGLLIGIVSLLALIGFLRSDKFRTESFFVLFLCGVTAGFRTANAVYKPHGVGSWRILLAVVVPIGLYLALRIPGWLAACRLSRDEHPQAGTVTPHDTGRVFCPVCHGRLDITLLVAGANRCSHCKAEFNVEVE